MKRLLLRRRGEKGQTLVEFVFVVMAFMLFIFGIIEGARMFQSWITIQHASREAARWGVTGQDDCAAATDNRLVCIETEAADNLTTLMDPSGAIIEVSHYEFPAFADPAFANDPGEPCDLLEVHVEYDHTVVVPFIGAITGDTVHLETEERMVNEPYGTC
jgi:Flp pilus assembly protein TadG